MVFTTIPHQIHVSPLRFPCGHARTRWLHSAHTELAQTASGLFHKASIYIYIRTQHTQTRWLKVSFKLSLNVIYAQSLVITIKLAVKTLMNALWLYYSWYSKMLKSKTKNNKEHCTGEVVMAWKWLIWPHIINDCIERDNQWQLLICFC